ncbi:CMP-N-acetylneuraminic acid synthetase [Winogradskyella sp. J14-2]|uniref:acylneuraminate cytidylyltransferase family protein n=1 Tax=Winogradskyella sp. J14-2 TaxID=1936080 RepID=UPI000972B876|nr:acylneuraminate cytidylyltransferase family protein [Winogradskyella sp. J14-2]APY07943.1 CMP-N-acetylneuraminic acid synthetase [Winogradskyella sp. J14-2]
MRPLVLIPARGGSKGVPGKNIKLLNGKPLIQYTIDAARAIFNDHVICVSTDDQKIKSTVESFGLEVPFLRPKVLATDTATSESVIKHALTFYAERGYHADTLILLQPTSPFRTAQHIKDALTHYNDNLDMLVSVKETKSNPYYVLREENEQGYLVKSKVSNATRRQDVPKVWELNGAIYIINTRSIEANSLAQLVKVKKFEMDELSSHDIDTVMDWKVAEEIFKMDE